MSVEGPLTEVPYHPGSPSILGDEHVPVEPVVARERNIAGVQLIQQDSPSAMDALVNYITPPRPNQVGDLHYSEKE